MTGPPPGRPRPRAARLDPDTRRGLIVDAAERLLAEHDPILVTFDQVAEAAGVSRSLVHAYLGDRRGLLDAVQVRIVSRLDAAAAPALAGEGSPADHLRALLGRVFAFVAAEQDAWGVLVVSGGLDHPALHGIRGRWAAALAPSPDLGPHEGPGTDPDDRVVAAQAVVAALLFGVGGWVHRGVDPARAAAPMLRALDPDG